MFRFLHAADIHMDSPLRGLESFEDAPVDQIRGAVRRAFDNLVDLAIREDVRFVLIGGDLFDGDWKDYNTGIYFNNRMGALREAGIEVFMVSGNHDAVSQISRALRLPDNVTLFSHREAETRILEDLGVAVHGQSFPSRAVLEDLTQGYPQAESGLFNIGLLHTALTGRPGHEPYAPCTLDGLKSKGYQYWALGHVHQREEVSRDPWIVFPGNIQGRHIRETGPRGCTMVTVDEGRVEAVEPYDLDVLRWAVGKVDLDGCEDEEACLERVRETMKDTLTTADGRPVALRLMLEGVTPLHGSLHERASHWIEEFRGIAAGLMDVWVEKTIFRTVKPSAYQVDSSDISPLSALEKEVEGLKKRKENLFEYAPELEKLRSKLPPELLDDDNPFDLSDEKMDDLCEDIRALLTGRILRREGRHEN
ncbi:MAG: DNA repair exonuclease [Deltaproteobacteria bacterium]|nr:DNA repair exonuclease [Deltaproteobacteria bacterium]